MAGIERINAYTPAEFSAAFGKVYEHSPWIAERALQRRPFKSLAQLKHALVQVLAEGGEAAQLALIRAHPELAGKAMVSKTLTAESTNEQTTSGLTNCTAEEFARIQQLNADYTSKRCGWRAITSSVLVPTDPVEPRMVTRCLDSVIGCCATSWPAARSEAKRPAGPAHRRGRATSRCCPSHRRFA